MGDNMKLYFTKTDNDYPITNIEPTTTCPVTDMKDFKYNGIGLDYICNADGHYCIVGDIDIVNGENVLTVKMF